ncbi:hypothetical protein GCM10009795_014000 [Nocardioides hankookensis]|uniref:TadE/TadG family type IV pilus assembly protein n=1 Tax=Nocardioides hankookensis TaxID=443157 RepID=A0ABW1LJG7_9ACTN
MSGRPRCLHRRRSRDERGAVAVEAALVLPILFTVLFGIVDLSMLVRDEVSTTSATRIAARIAATGAGAGPGTCVTRPSAPPCTSQFSPALAQAAADAIQRSGMSMPKDSIDYILVYKANDQGFPGTGTSMPSDCSATTDCVMFTWYDADDKFRWAGGSWDSKTINGCLNQSDMVGVYLHATHDWASGIFGSSIGVDDRAVSRFEPLDPQTCAPGTHG